MPLCWFCCAAAHTIHKKLLHTRHNRENERDTEAFSNHFTSLIKIMINLLWDKRFTILEDLTWLPHYKAMHLLCTPTLWNWLLQDREIDVIKSCCLNKTFLDYDCDTKRVLKTPSRENFDFWLWISTLTYSNWALVFEKKKRIVYLIRLAALRFVNNLGNFFWLNMTLLTFHWGRPNINIEKVGWHFIQYIKVVYTIDNCSVLSYLLRKR